MRLADQLRLERLRADAAGPAAPPEARVSLALAEAAADPAAATAAVEAVLAERPDAAFAAHALLAIAVRHAGWDAVTAALARVERAGGRPPPWIERFALMTASGIAPMGPVRLKVDTAAVEPFTMSVLADGGYEGAEAAAIVSLVRPGDRVLEAGAGLGYIAALGASAPGVAWHAFEANGRLVPLLEETRALNGLGFSVEHAAWTDRDGPATFRTTARGLLASSVLPQHDDLASESVPGVDGARIIAAARPSVLVMDIEGGEYLVLPRADLAGVRAMLLELHPAVVGDRTHTALLSHLLGAGFLIDAALSEGDVLALYRA
jgi:FkbM family methyltransferase